MIILYRTCACNNKSVCGADVILSYVESYKSFPKNEEDFIYYCQNLYLQNIDDLWQYHCNATQNKKLMVSTLHFYAVDRDEKGQIRNRTLVKQGRGTYAMGQPKTSELPCPGATLQDVLNDPRNITKNMISSSSAGSDLNMITNTTRSQRYSNRGSDLNSGKRDSSTADDDSGLDGSLEVEENYENGNPKKLRRKTENVMVHKTSSFIADVKSTFCAFTEIDDHARKCVGHFKHSSDRDVTFHGVCVTIRLTCSLGKDCSGWEDGIFQYHSQEPIKTSDFLSSHGIFTYPDNLPQYEYKGNLQHVIAESTTGVMPDQGKTYLNHFQLRTRSTYVTAWYRNNIVNNMINGMSLAEDIRVAQVYGGVLLSEQIMVVFDGAHSSTRNAQHTLGAFGIVGCNQLLHVGIRSRIQSPSSVNEDKILRSGIGYMCGTLGVLLSAMGSDQSSSGLSIIRELVGEAVCDIWHLLKSLKKMLESFLLKFIEETKFLIGQYAAIIKNATDTTISIEQIKNAVLVLGKVIVAENNFDTIHSQFCQAGHGMERWSQVIHFIPLLTFIKSTSLLSVWLYHI